MTLVPGSGRKIVHSLHAGLLALCACGTALGQTEILNIHNAALTSYQPSGATSIQGIRPLNGAQQYGVQLDGAARSVPLLGWGVNGNPFEKAPMSGGSGDIRFDTGTYAPQIVDLALPATGFSMVFGRTYNGRQETSAPAHRDSDGPQGKNWFQSGLPEIVFVSPGGGAANDMVYIVYGADRYVAFKRTGSGDSTFKGVNGAAGGIVYSANSSGEPETYTYYDPYGRVTTFLGFDGDAGSATGQFWKMSDAAGNTAFVGSATLSASTATTGYSSGRATAIYDASDRRYTLAYTTLDSVVRLTQIKAETKASGTWGAPSGVVTVGQVDYDYYQSGSTIYGDAGNLKLVTVTTPLTDSGINLIRKTHYRYWTGLYNALTNPGHPNTIQYVVEAEGYRRADWADTNFNDTPLTMSEGSLKPYAALYLKYDSSFRISEFWMNGQCGCGGGASNGVHTITYGASGYTNNSGYDTDWATRTVVDGPDNFRTIYFDEVGQIVADVVTDGDPAAGSPPPRWVTRFIRNSAGQVTQVHSPAVNTGYTHSTGSFTSSTSVGLVTEYTRVSASTHTKGFAWNTGHRQGTSGTLYYDRSAEFADDNEANNSPETTIKVTVGGTLDIYRPNVWFTHDYATEGTSLLSPIADTDNTVNQVTYSGQLVLETSERKDDKVSFANNGSNSADVSMVSLREDGTSDFSKSRDARIDYRAYTNGQLTTAVTDADTSLTAGGQFFDGVSIPSGFSKAGAAKHLVTTYTYDPQGRPSTVITPQHQGSGTSEHTRTYYSKLLDGRAVTVSIPYVKTVGGNVTYFGPARYTVTNLAGKAEFTGTIALSSSGITTALTSWVDETDADPITALDVGSLSMVTTNIYNESAGQLNASRTYFNVPGSGAGSAGTNYDERVYGYDDAGRVRRTLDPTGTINRTVFDAKGRSIQTWLGTDDTGDAGGMVGGTNNMVKTSQVQYDGGSAGGNSLVTLRTAYIEDSTTGQRQTAYTNDYRGRAVIVDNPTGPDQLYKYNNLGQVIVTGTYSTAASLTGSSDPAAVTLDRVGRIDTDYDEKHRAFKTTRHEIDPSDGSDDSNLVTSLTWYDAEGRVIKTRGESLTKTIYDRLGRATNRYVLAKVNEADNSYGDADDVTGDIVLEEHETYYEDTTGLTLMTVSISRHPDDDHTGTTGPLDVNKDTDLSVVNYSGNDIEGRAQITSYFYDDLNRLTDIAVVGTNSGSNFSRSGASTTRSTTNLVTSYSYTDDGLRKDVTDPKNLVTRTVYDGAGRKVTTIANYVNGTPSGPTGADDVHTRYEYTNGLMTKMWVDLDGDNNKDSDDQVTTYIFGTTKGTPSQSEMATGHLLRAVKYPDSSNAGTTNANINSDSSDVVSYAYNAQGQQVYMKDQAGNVIETDFDTAGRKTQRRATSINTGAGFDDYVQRIETTYNSRGMVEQVNQYNDPDVGQGTMRDQVQYTYDKWGNLTDFDQDVDSEIGVSGRAVFAVDYAYSTASPSDGRATIRRTSTTLPGSVIVTNDFGSSGTIADTASRVAKLTQGGVDVALYEYLGSGQVVSTSLASILTSSVHSSGASYPYLDEFNRITSSRWTKGIDLYRVDLEYDENSNVTRAQDYVHTWTSGNHLFDVQYTMDGMNRLTQAEEGHWNGSSVTSDTRNELWTALSQTGNWERHKLDLDGDGSFTIISGSPPALTGELDDTATFNKANEYVTRNIDSSGVSTTPSTDFSQDYDVVGNMIDDGKDYKYAYDVFGRLVAVKNQSNALVAEYRYNGLGYRTGWHYDADVDNNVDGSDPWYYFTYDSKWRPVATFRGSDANPKERFTFHNAGPNGYGGSSYVDLIVLRDRDANTNWVSIAGDGTLEERNFYCQNWRADVSVVTDDAGTPVEWIKYSAYGVPSSYSLADFDHDGDVDGDDYTAFFAAMASTGPGNADVNFDGDTGTDADIEAFDAAHTAASTGGPGRLSRSRTGNRIGYAGYQWDQAAQLDHVRHRAYRPDLGRWFRRDPENYADGFNLYAYAGDSPLVKTDPQGLIGLACSRVIDVYPGLSNSGSQTWHQINLGDIQPCLEEFILHLTILNYRRFNDCEREARAAFNANNCLSDSHCEFRFRGEAVYPCGINIRKGKFTCSRGGWVEYKDQNIAAFVRYEEGVCVCNTLGPFWPTEPVTEPVSPEMPK